MRAIASPTSNASPAQLKLKILIWRRDVQKLKTKTWCGLSDRMSIVKG